MRNKPQFNVSLSYFKDGWLGGHNFKFGTESRWEERAFFADQPFNLVYYDTVLNQTPSEVEFYNTPNDGINNTNAFSLYASDTWRLNDKITLNLGLRFDRYHDFWPEQTVDPGGVPELAGTTDPRLHRAVLAARRSPDRPCPSRRRSVRASASPTTCAATARR